MKKKKFYSTTYKPIKKCDKVKNYNEISATEYKINSKYDRTKKISILLFYANETLEDSSRFKGFIDTYIDKKFDVIMGFHNVVDEELKFVDKSNKKDVFFLDHI